MSTVAERLREAMSDAGVDQSALARAIGVTQGSISLILLGKTRQSKHLPEIATELNVAYDWLVGRLEDKYANRPSEHLLTPAEVDIVLAVRAMPNLNRIAVERVVQGITLLEREREANSLPTEAALTRMFDALLLATRRLDEGERAHELARRLPKALGALRGPLIEPASVPPDVATEPAEAPPSNRRAPRRASRT